MRESYRPLSGEEEIGAMGHARRRHTPEQVIRKLREADRLLGEGQEVAGAARKIGAGIGAVAGLLVIAEVGRAHRPPTS